jgi:hypothetical protein
MAVTQIAYKDGNNASKTANAGSDGTNTTTGITIFDSSGAYVATLPVSVATLPALTTGAAVIGAVTQSGTWTTATNADGTIAAGTAPSKALTAGLIYNSSPITLTTGQGAALQSDANGYLKVSVAGAIVQTVGGTTVTINNQITRPANTTAYTAGDVVNDNSTTTFAFANAARIAAGSGSVFGCRMILNSTTTANATFRLWLFNASPGALTDNAAYSLTYAQRGSRIGYFDLAAPIVGSDCVEIIGTSGQSIPMGFDLPSGTTLYGVLTATAAYVPTSGETIDIYLQIAQD